MVCGMTVSEKERVSRKNKEWTSMKPRLNDEELSREELTVRVAEQRATISAQQSRIAELTATVAEQEALIRSLRAKVDELERASKRQAAPFSKGKRVKHPKPSGRKQGEGTFTYRTAPREEEWTEPPIDVKVEEERCPECGGRLEEERIEIATVTELPKVIRPRVTPYRVSVCRCQACGKRVRGRHPDLAPDQYGATAHRLGPRLKAAGHALHYKIGVPVRKVPEVLQELCGVSVTQSALTQDALKQAEPPSKPQTEETVASSVEVEAACPPTNEAAGAPGIERRRHDLRLRRELQIEAASPLRAEAASGSTGAAGSPVGVEARSTTRPGGKIGQAYKALRASVKEAPIVNTDDTGWRIGGEPAFLMTFDTNRATVYQIRRRHRNEEVRELVPGNYSGVMGCDRGKSYDAKELAGVKQQKCIGHIDRSLVKELEGQEGADREFPETFRGQLGQANELWKTFQAGTIDRAAYDAAGTTLKRDVMLLLLGERLRLLRDAPDPKARSEADRSHARILDQIGWQFTRGHLLRFLEDPAIEPTNNRAERALRPAVIARKVSHCSKNDRGAEAFGAFTSVIQTLVKAGDATVDPLAHVMLFGPIALHGPSPPPSA